MISFVNLQIDGAPLHIEGIENDRNLIIDRGIAEARFAATAIFVETLE